VAIGFVYSITTTLGSVLAVRRLQGKQPIVSSTPTSVSIANNAPPPKPFSDEQWQFFWIASLVTGILSVTAGKTNNNMASPLQMLFTMALTVSSYIFGTRLPSGFVKVHPLVTSSTILLLLIRGLSVAVNKDFLKILKTYKTGSLNPMKAGAGDYLLYILGPSVVSFAVSVYSRKSLLFQNLPMVVTAMFVSSVGGLFATGAFVRLIQLGGTSTSAALVRLSVLARNITTALAMALTDMLGGDMSIVSAVVCLTGIIGASYGIPLLDALGVKDPICRGLGIGSSSQGLGVASMAKEVDAFPFAAIAMVLTAIAATTLVSFPVARDALIRITTGDLSSIVPTP
jgi:putative effector of murein hydrolase